MNKEEFLQILSSKISSGEITQEEVFNRVGIVTKNNANLGEVKEGRHFSINKILYLLGAAILVIGIIIFVGAIGSVYGSSLLPYSGANATLSANAGNTTTSTGDFNTNVGRTIFHPKVIGMVFILIVGTFTIQLLARGPAK